MRHRYECPLRWADMDQLRHVNNVKYGDYLQEARVDFFRHLALRVSAHDEASVHDDAHDDGADRSEEERFGIVVVRHEITYLAPLHFDSAPVLVETWVSEVRAASFTVGYEVFREDTEGIRTVFLRASTRLAPFVFGSARPRRLTDREHAALAPYVETPEEPRPDGPTRRAAVRHEALGHYPVHVRFSDLDPYGHVNNVTYLEYFQEGRVAMNGRLWGSLPAGTPRAGLVVAQVDVDYVRPMLSKPDGYELWTSVRHVGGRSAVMDSEICERGTDVVMARASTVIVFFDLETNRSVEPPEPYRAALLAALAPAEPG